MRRRQIEPIRDKNYEGHGTFIVLYRNVIDNQIRALLMVIDEPGLSMSLSEDKLSNIYHEYATIPSICALHSCLYGISRHVAATKQKERQEARFQL